MQISDFFTLQKKTHHSFSLIHPLLKLIGHLLTLSIVLVSKDTHKECILRNKAKVFLITSSNTSEIFTNKSKYNQTQDYS